MAESEIKIVSQFSKADVESAGLPAGIFNREVFMLGGKILDNYVAIHYHPLVFPDEYTAHRWMQLCYRYDEQIEIFSQYGHDESVLGKVDNLIVPMSDAMINGHDGNEEDCGQILDYLDYDGVLALDGMEMVGRESFDHFPPLVGASLKLGLMFIMHDTTDELVEISQSSDGPEDYQVYQSRVLFFRAGEILVKTNGICLADISSNKRREKISLTDQYRFLISLIGTQDIDPEQSELGQTHPIMTQAHFRSASNLVKLLLNPPINELRETARRYHKPGEHNPVDVSSERFIAVAEHVSRIRAMILKHLTCSDDPLSDQTRSMVEEGLNNPATAEIVAEFLRLNDPKNIWSVHRESVKKGHSKMAELVKARALKLDNRPFLVAEDLPKIYDPALQAMSAGDVTTEQLQQIIKATRLYSQRDFSFEGDDLLFGGIEYGQMKVPAKIQVRFDRHQPQRRFVIQMEYADAEEKTLTHGLEFDLQKGGFIDWQMLELATEPEMAGLFHASLGLTRSVLEVIRNRCDVVTQERKALKVAVTPAKKGPHVPALKFVTEKPRPESILDAPIVAGDKRGQVRDEILIPEGDDLRVFLRALKGHRQSVIKSLLDKLDDFNQAEIQVGIEPVQVDKKTGPFYKLRCDTDAGEFRVLLEPAGAVETEEGRTRLWKPLTPDRRNGFYQRLRLKYGLKKKRSRNH